MRKWKCMVCGYIHTGSQPPATCPVCGSDQSFIEVTEAIKRLWENQKKKTWWRF